MKNGFYSLQEYQAEKTNNLLYITVNPSAGGIRRSKTDLDKTRIIDIVIYKLNDHTLINTEQIYIIYIFLLLIYQ